MAFFNKFCFVKRQKISPGFLIYWQTLPIDYNLQVFQFQFQKNHDILSFMKISIIIANIVTRISTFLLRIIGSGGTSLPGKAGMVFKRNLLQLLSNNIKVVLITGTNGKTTTSRIIAEIMKKAGFTYFENKSGANLISGITASFSLNSTLTGNPKYDYAVIECDEAAFKTVCPMIKPHTIVVTNLFRDQLDRFGEITHTLNNIFIGIKASSDSVVVLNADDSLSFSLAETISNKIILFGLDSPPHGSDSDFLSDAPYCIRCKAPYTYEYRTYAHLGKFFCSNCGYHRHQPAISAGNTTLLQNSSKIDLVIHSQVYSCLLALPGAYNIYNALSAVAAADSFLIKHEVIVAALSSFNSGFGRMEILDLDGTAAHMILVKNPAGLNQVINFLSTDSTRKLLVLILNDNYADGTDISWIWDANFEKIKSFSDTLDKIIVSGIRAEELKIRLKYAEFDENEIILEKNYKKLINFIVSDTADSIPVYILPTYTAMFDFRKALSKKYKIRKFWK